MENQIIEKMLSHRRSFSLMSGIIDVLSSKYAIIAYVVVIFVILGIIVAVMMSSSAKNVKKQVVVGSGAAAKGSKVADAAAPITVVASADGEKKYTCTACGATKTEKLDKKEGGAEDSSCATVAPAGFNGFGGGTALMLMTAFAIACILLRRKREM